MSTYRYNEILLSILTIFWGVIFMLPGDVFEALQRFQPLYLRVPDQVFGIVMVVTAIPGIMRMPLRYRQVAHGLLFGLWSFITYLPFVQGLTIGTFLGSSVFFVIALLYGGNCWRITQEIRLLDE